jgi:signal recognition particle GTPase
MPAPCGKTQRDFGDRVNGVGKTTTIAKWQTAEAGGKKVMLGQPIPSGAANDQLGVWSQRVGVDL